MLEVILTVLKRGLKWLHLTGDTAVKSRREQLLNSHLVSTPVLVCEKQVASTHPLDYRDERVGTFLLSIKDPLTALKETSHLQKNTHLTCPVSAIVMKYKILNLLPSFH